MTDPFAWTASVAPIAALPPGQLQVAVWCLTAYPASDLEHTCKQLDKVAARLTAGISLDEQVAQVERDMARLAELEVEK